MTHANASNVFRNKLPKMFTSDHSQNSMATFLDEKIKPLAKVPLPVNVVRIEERERKIQGCGSPAVMSPYKSKKVGIAKAGLLNDDQFMHRLK